MALQCDDVVVVVAVVGVLDLADHSVDYSNFVSCMYICIYVCMGVYCLFEVKSDIMNT